MIYQPKTGQKVLIRYRPGLRGETRLHLAEGIITVVGSGNRPKNCLINIGLYKVVIPRGNLFKIKVNDGMLMHC